MSETETIISTIHTSCKDCVFAIYNDNTQTDCSMNMIEKYQNKGSKIIEAYDDEKEFFIINERKCIWYRVPSWFNQFEDANDSLEYRVTKAKEFNQINYMMLIDLKLFTIEELEKTFIEISNLDIKPKRIIFLRYNYTNNIFEFDTIKGLIDRYKIVCAWRIQTMVKKDVELRSIVSSTINFYKMHKFVLYMTNYSNTVNSIINTGNKIVFDDLDTFSLIKDKEDSVSLFSGLVYRYLWFMEGKDILVSDSETIIV